MKNKKVKKVFEYYAMIGKSLCACAGGIVGFVLGGPFVAIPGIIAGSIGGSLILKGMINNMLK